MDIVRNKLILESPDEIEANNLEKLRPGVKYLSLNNFQFPFGYYNGKMRIGKVDEVHPGIKSSYPDMKGFQGLNRAKMDFAGRLWPRERIISFWTYPKSKQELLSIVKDIEDEFYERFKKHITILPKDWLIEIVEKREGEAPWPGFGDWGNATEAKLIPMSEYEGSEEWSEEQKNTEHMKSPLLKNKREVPYGFGSKNPKYMDKRRWNMASLTGESKKENNDMKLIAESLDNFLFEDLGNLKKFKNLPNEWKKSIISGSGYDSKLGGKNSSITSLPTDIDYKSLLNILKEPFNSVIISIDGLTKYMLRRESERKFTFYDADQTGTRKDERRRLQDEEYKRKEAERNRNNESLNEARRRPYYGTPSDGNIGNISIPELIEKVKKWRGEDKEIEIDIIGGDEERLKLRTKRSEERLKNLDQLDPKQNSFSNSASQTKRYEKYAAKKRVKIDRLVDDEIEKLRNGIINNFDDAMKSIISDLRKGYTSQASSDKIGAAILKGIDLSGIQRLAKAYDAVEPRSYSSNSAQSSKELKNLGII